jgi:hypothetical protein
MGLWQRFGKKQISWRENSNIELAARASRFPDSSLLLQRGRYTLNKNAAGLNWDFSAV